MLAPITRRQCAMEVLWGTGDANITKTGFPKSRSVAFKRSSFRFLFDCLFFRGIVRFVAADTRAIFAKSIPLCADGMTFDGRVTVAVCPRRRGSRVRALVRSDSLTDSKYAQKGSKNRYQFYSRIRFQGYKCKMQAQKLTPEGTQRDFCIGTRHRRLNEFLYAKGKRTQRRGRRRAAAGGWRSTIAPSDTRPICVKGFVPFFT